MAHPVDMTGRVCLVTGATSGIGEATARGLARMGDRVLIHGRDAERGARVVDEIRATTVNSNVDSVVGDFASLASVRALAADVRRKTDRLHVLVNNAGAMYPERRESAD